MTAATDPSIRNVLKQPFREQVDFFRAKLNLPTDRWDDIRKAAHDRAFIVAGAAKADLLDDLQGAVEKAIADGESIAKFRERFQDIVKRNGWHGWTGQGTKKGEAWRTRVIYQTNLTQSYNAGRYQQLNDPDLVKRRPYWKYVHNDTVAHPRPLHVSWSGKVLHKDDPWWQTHFPANGWGCQCYVTAVPPSEFKGDSAPDDGFEMKQDSQGNWHRVPKGIDLGFDYAPGSNVDTSLRTMVQNKLIKHPQAISRALTRDINRYINANESVVGFAARAITEKNNNDDLWLGFVENADKIKQATGLDLANDMVLLPAQTVRHVEKSRAFDGKEQRVVEHDDFNHIMDILLNYDQIEQGNTSRDGKPSLLISKKVDKEWFRLVFEVQGKKKRAIALKSLVIKLIKPKGE